MTPQQEYAALLLALSINLRNTAYSISQIKGLEPISYVQGWDIDAKADYYKGLAKLLCPDLVKDQPVIPDTFEAPEIPRTSPEPMPQGEERP